MREWLTWTFAIPLEQHRTDKLRTVGSSSGNFSGRQRTAVGVSIIRSQAENYKLV